MFQKHGEKQSIIHIVIKPFIPNLPSTSGDNSSWLSDCLHHFLRICSSSSNLLEEEVSLSSMCDTSSSEVLTGLAGSPSWESDSSYSNSVDVAGVSCSLASGRLVGNSLRCFLFLLILLKPTFTQ